MSISTHGGDGTHWDEEATGYDAIMGSDPAMGALYEGILREVPEGSRSVLDVGTGTGVLLQLIRRLHSQCRLVGLDPAPTMLEIAAAKLAGDPLASFVRGSADALNFSDGEFDTVVSNFALHHLTHAEKQVASCEVFRALAPGGRFIFGDQHCRRMGASDDPAWVEDMFDLLCAKSRHYLSTAGKARMLLQVRMMPRFLTCDGEIPATVEFWLECLTQAGFSLPRVIVAGPEFLHHRVIVAIKPLRS